MTQNSGKQKSELTNEEILTNQIVLCKACPLEAQCKGPVPFEGSFSAQIMAIGEAPGETEDAEGIPFIGTCGKELRKTFEGSGLFLGKNCVVTNVVKCRPPNNRAPGGEEIAACSHWINAEIEWVKPKAVILLGRTAQEALLPYTSAGHGSKFRAVLYGHECQVAFMYHPSYWLRMGGKDYIKENVNPLLEEWTREWRKNRWLPAKK